MQKCVQYVKPLKFEKRLCFFFLLVFNLATNAHNENENIYAELMHSL